MKLPLYQVDAFTSQPFQGNPAAVCPLPHWLEDTTLQQIAAENNLSETAFFVKEDDGLRIRWFSPVTEVDLCGHATLATGFVILGLLQPEWEEVNFASASGPLSVRRQGERFQLDFPNRPGTPVDCPPQLPAALGLEPETTLLSSDCLVVVGDEREVRKLAPDFALLARVPGRGVLVTAPGSDCDCVSRCFFPELGIPEDPVTGSAHCTIAPYWGERLGKSSLFCRQVSPRGGELWCDLEGDRVKIAGDCVLYLEGEIRVEG